RADQLPALIPETLAETGRLTQQMGWVFVASLFLRAYSLGGGTYTGIEAVSNNVQSLVEPRVRTGKWTMFYMALSLAFTAPASSSSTCCGMPAMSMAARSTRSPSNRSLPASALAARR